jgi:chromosomal replication initiation ATPase DnaA
VSLDLIISTVKSVAEEDNAVTIRMSIYLCHRYSGPKLKEIGERFGVGESAVSQTSRRFSASLKEDTSLREEVEQVVNGWKLTGVYF